VEPLPETDEALDEYLEEDDSDLREVLVELGRAAVTIVPSCVGLSLGLVRDGLTFTLVATSREIAAIDAAQYLDGGPCVAVATGSPALDTNMSDLLDEACWTTFALASAAKGVMSTLSLPVEHNREVTGGINLYAAVPDAFRGKSEALAAALGASAQGAVSNADLGFTTRALAVQTPSLLAEKREVDVAIGRSAAWEGIDVDTARARLESAAARAGISMVEAAEVLNYLYGSAE
jgi:transcriptional regulator with GAF, ATPase, and Fis domain